MRRDELTRQKLYELAVEQGVSGRASMTKGELLDAVTVPRDL